MQLPQRQLDVAAPLITSAARRSDGDQALPRATGSPPAGPPEALNRDKRHRELNELPRITQTNHREHCALYLCDLHFLQWLDHSIVFSGKLRVNGEVSASGAASAACQLRGDGIRQQSQRAVASSRHDVGICRAVQRNLFQAAVALKP